MHIWGDEWFIEHGNHLYEAINDLETRIRKWAKMGVCGKEKWGAYRDEYLSFWNGGISQIFFGYRATYYHNIVAKIMYKFDHCLIPIKKTKFGWVTVGIADLNRKIGLTKIVNNWQARMLNKAFQITCKEYPDVVDELIVDVDCYELIKPCKWGDVDGEVIHKKYWKKLDKESK